MKVNYFCYHKFRGKWCLNLSAGASQGVFPCQNNLKDLDPSCKMDLDLWDCF